MLYQIFDYDRRQFNSNFDLIHRFIPHGNLGEFNFYYQKFNNQIIMKKLEKPILIVDLYLTYELS